MISDIQSMLNKTTNKQNASSSVLSHQATIAKLSNEMKLIESLGLIKIQNSETLLQQGRPVQLIHAINSQQPFTIINAGVPLDTSHLKSAQLDKTNTQQIALTTTKETLPNHPPQKNRVEGLSLASRVINLTVVSSLLGHTQKSSLENIVSHNNIPPAPNDQTAINTKQTNLSTTVTNTNNAQTQTSTNPAQNSQPKQNNSVILTPTQSMTLQEQTGNRSGQQTNTLTTQNITPQTQPPQLSNSHLANNQQASNQAFQLMVSDGENEFPIISQTALKRGEVIRVMLDTNNNLQVLPNKAPEITSTPHMDALKQSLPKQLSLNDLTQMVKQLQVIEQSANSLPKQTQHALTQLMQGIPTLSQLTATPDGMKQALQSTGGFTESLLLTDNKVQIQSDFKLNLSHLKETQESLAMARLGNVSTEQIANAIERITTTQLRHFSEANPATNSATIYPLYIELPIKNGLSHSMTQIEIHQDSSTTKAEKHERRWLVKLKFDFDETGKFEARTSIQGDKVSIIFIAEDKVTIQKLQQNLPDLESKLREKNIEIERLNTFQGKLKEDENTPTQQKSLIDVRT